MLKGLYTSAVGMTVQMKKMDVVSNNIANADTTGFKRDIPVTQSFSELLDKRLDDYSDNNVWHEKPVGMVSLGAFVDNVYTDFSDGALQATGGALELALSGSGFFAIETADGERYTRDGSFALSASRELVTKDGNYVLGQNGVITVPDGEIVINSQGDIIVNGEIADRLMLVDVENKESLRKIGDNLYAADGAQFADFAGDVVQGCLEGSNSNVVREMVEMMTVLRVYEANQKVIAAYDTNLGRAVNDIARK